MKRVVKQGTQNFRDRVFRCGYVFGLHLFVKIAVEALRVARGRGSHIFRHSAHRWRQGCQPYAPAAFYPQEDPWYSFLLEGESTPGP
jgi:hypothetical protein